MAEPSPQKDEEVTKEENSFVESGAHTNHSNVLNESPLKEEEAITDTVKESVPEPLETKRTPSPSISNHSQDVGNTDKHDALSTPSSSTENLADNAGNGRESPAPSDPQKHETPSDPHVMKPGGKPGTPDDTHTSGCDDIICHERDPNDIEPEIKKNQRLKLL
uniref:Uncharacterized protein n=1 Tax=Panagrolaimus superbus TaxID=310955 RepID=A0A914YDB4_9BILA